MQKKRPKRKQKTKPNKLTAAKAARILPLLASIPYPYTIERMAPPFKAIVAAHLVEILPYLYLLGLTVTEWRYRAAAVLGEVVTNEDPLKITCRLANVKG